MVDNNRLTCFKLPDRFPQATITLVEPILIFNTVFTKCTISRYSHLNRTQGQLTHRTCTPRILTPLAGATHISMFNFLFNQVIIFLAIFIGYLISTHHTAKLIALYKQILQRFFVHLLLSSMRKSKKLWREEQQQKL